MTTLRKDQTVDSFLDGAATARVWDYLQGGKDNQAQDRAFGEQLIKVNTSILTAVKESRRFVLRAVRYLADAGIRQFVDIGVGLPSGLGDVHTVAQAVDPASRVVYVDHDPLVMCHARALLVGTSQDTVGFIQEDLREPEKIINALPGAGIDLSKPAALVFGAVLHELGDDEQPHAVVRRLVDALAPGSYLVISHLTTDTTDKVSRQELGKFAADYKIGPFEARDRGQVEEFVAGLELVEPGLVSTVQWRPDVDPPANTLNVADAMCYAVVARIP